MPGFEGIRLVCANEQVQISLGLLGLELLQGVKGVGGAFSVNLTRVHQCLRHIGKSQTCHGQSVWRWCERACLVPGVARGDDAQLVQVELLNRVFGQRDVRNMWRVKRTTKDA